MTRISLWPPLLVLLAFSVAAERASEHWAFRPIAQQSPPQVQNGSWPANAIDRFILAKLEDKGLSASRPADKLTLLRRATLDLTGLPPTPREIEQFISDTSPDAYEKLIDRLLASPQYGERWARHWLDVVRFGESHGYEQNHLRDNAWHYRDYVIRAFNEDKPYDRFILEQLAGDVVGRGDPLIEPATGFLVAGVHDTVGIQNEEGQRQQRVNDLEDIVSTTSAAFLGLTVGCARCHDHKFDPIPQKDYYSMAAVFAGVRHQDRPLPTKRITDEERAKQAELARRMRGILGEINDLELQARGTLAKEAGLAPRPAVSTRRNVEEFAPTRARFVRITVAATTDGIEPCFDEIEIYTPRGENVALASGGAKPSASSVLPNNPIHQIHHLNDGRFGNDHSWISNELSQGWAQIELPQTTEIYRVIWSRDSLEQPRYSDRLAAKYRVEVSADGQTWTTVSTEAGRATAAESLTQEKLVAAMTEQQRERRKALAGERDEVRKQLATAEPVKAYIGGFSAPDVVHRLRRGDVMKPLEVSPPAALSQISGLSAGLELPPDAPEPQRRVALAKWITDPRNPLTARVIVNRIWQQHFGRALVNTPSDFGLAGEKPSHPELLDYLAGQMTKNNWQLKGLHKLIMLSSTYRQAGLGNPANAAIDAGNVFLWHMPPRRLEAEAIRDSILSASGKLDLRMFGPGFRLYKYNVVNVAIYDPLVEQGPETWRRAIYHQSSRGIRDDLLTSFDQPDSAQRTRGRDVTTNPLQALTLMNSPFILQQADLFAQRVAAEAGESAELQVRQAFLIALSREPTDSEKQSAVELIQSRGLAVFCRALFNANEFLTY